MTGPQCSVFIASGIPADPAYGSFPGVGKLSEAEVEEQSTIRHARYFGRAPSFAARAAARLHDQLAHPIGRVGILCNGGPWNLQPSWNFIARGRKAGPNYLNPLQFPPTLVSATATTAAAAIGAHAFAYVVGHDRLAFFAVLAKAAQAIRNDLADHVLAIGLSTGGAAIKQAAAGIGWREPLDVALGFAIGGIADQTGLCLLDASDTQFRSNAWANATVYEADIQDDCTSFPIPTSFSDQQLLGATGAALCLAAAMHHDRLTPDERGKEFLISGRYGARSAFAVFKFVGASEGQKGSWGPYHSS